jgi:hypothetical protein
MGKGYAQFVDPASAPELIAVLGALQQKRRPGNEISAAADFMGPGTIEINRYQTEITDMVRRRGVFGQRIKQTPATGQPSRYFEQLAIPVAGTADPRALTATSSQPQRVERTILLKAITAQINYGLFDVEVNQQQGQFAHLEAKDLTDTVDGVLKLHDQNLWTGADTDTLVSTSNAYYGCSGQIYAGANSTTTPGNPVAVVPASTGSIVDTFQSAVAAIAQRTDFEVRPTTLYMDAVFSNRLNKEAKAFQLYFNQTEIMPGVVVNALPTVLGDIPIIVDQFITQLSAGGGTYLHSGFLVTDDMIEFHYLTDPLPRVFQLGLLGNLAAQYVVVKFGGVIVKGAPYAHQVLQDTF